MGVFCRIWLLTVVALVLVWCFAMEVLVCCSFWRSYLRDFVGPMAAPVEALVVDLGVLIRWWSWDFGDRGVVVVVDADVKGFL
ncbi:hypothetical protein QL285_045893 [Trifolium repens]|nr:hypothetical protein QL285_045893 [Trifolium repens]